MAFLQNVERNIERRTNIPRSNHMGLLSASTIHIRRKRFFSFKNAFVTSSNGNVGVSDSFPNSISSDALVRGLPSVPTSAESAGNHTPLSNVNAATSDHIAGRLFQTANAHSVCDCIFKSPLKCSAKKCSANFFRRFRRDSPVPLLHVRLPAHPRWRREVRARRLGTTWRNRRFAKRWAG